MGLQGFLIRTALPLAGRLSRFKSSKNSAAFLPKIKKTETEDPADPVTWWLSYASRKHRHIPIMAQMYDHAMCLSGVSARKFYYEAQVHISVMAAVAAYYHFDGVSGGGDIYNYEVEAMGQKMIYSDIAMPTVDSRECLIKKPADLLKIKIPDWSTAARIPFVLEVLRMNGRLGSRMGKFCAPFSMAVALRSYPKLIRDMRRDPSFAHDLFSFIVDDVLPSYLKVQKKHCKIRMASGADAWSVFPNLTPELMETWVLPYAQRLFRNCSNSGIVAMCGGAGDYCEERVEKFDKEMLFKCFDIQRSMMLGMPMLVLGLGRWHEYPLEPVVEYLRPFKEQGIRLTFSANLNARFLRDGPVEKIVGTVKRFIDLFARDHNLIVSMANIPADTPPRHIHAAIAATHTYGRFPIAENLDDVSFQIPQRESFQEYVSKKTSNVTGVFD